MQPTMKITLAVVAALLLCTAAYSAVSRLFPSQKLALTAFPAQITGGTVVFGSRLVEPTFENHVIQLATHIIVGTVLTTPPDGTHEGFYEVRVDENMLARTAENIKVHGEGNLLKLGESYLMLLTRFAHTVYPFDFYVIDRDFVFRTGATGEVQRLINPVERTFVPPFQDSRYNSLARLREYIRSLAPANRIRSLRRDRDVQVVEEAASHAALIAMSDHILLIEIVSARLNLNGMLARVEFKTLNEFKGEGRHGLFTLLLPADVSVNGRYLVFLAESREAGYVDNTLATRRGSVVGEHDAQFNELLQILTASRP